MTRVAAPLQQGRRRRRRAAATVAGALAVAMCAVPPAGAMPAGDDGPAAASRARTTADFTLSPARPVVGNRLRLDARRSKCAAAPCRYTWSIMGARNAPRGRTAWVRLARAGRVSVTLRVRDARGRTAKRTRALSVRAAAAAPPPVAPSSPSPPPGGAPVTGAPAEPAPVPPAPRPVEPVPPAPRPVEPPPPPPARDVQPPAPPVIHTPTPGSRIPTQAVTLTGTAERGARVDLEGAGRRAATTADAGGAWSASVETLEGPQTWAATATDAAGNVSAPSAAVDFVVDLEPPASVVDEGPTGPVTQTSAQFAFSASEPGVTFECALRGPGRPEAFAPCASPARFDALAPGSYVFTVRARDSAGHVEEAGASRTFSVLAPPPGADVFVAVGGSDAAVCSVQAPCASLRRAVAVAVAGDVIEVAGGEYGDQVLPAGSARVTVRGAAGARPSLGVLDVSAEDISFSALRVRQLNVRGSRQIYDDVEIDGRFAKHVGLEHWQGDDVVFRNGRIGNITDEKGALIGPGNFTFDRVEFHHVRASNPLVHNECLFASGADGLTVRNSWFHACATMDIFFTNYADGPDYGNVTLENNVFEHATTEDPDEWHFYSVYIASTGPSNRLTNWNVRYNTFETAARVVPTQGTGRWIANLGDWDCVEGVTFKYNVGLACGELDNGVSPAASTATKPAPFGWTDPAAHDFTLKPDSWAIDAGDPTDYPPTDRTGTPRPQGTAPDAGAHEHPTND